MSTDLDELVDTEARVLLVPAGGEWRRRSACHGAPVAWFYDAGHRDYAEARAVCASCPVREPCLLDALESEDHRWRFGMFGGLSPSERSAFVRRTA